MLAVVLALVSMLGSPLAWLHAEGLFDDPAKDFGTVPRGTTLIHQFRLKNTTSDTLHVSSVRSSCQCAVPTVGRAELQPGETTAVTVTIDTRKYSGSRVFTVFVQFDRPFVQETRLTIQKRQRGHGRRDR
jgi:hypothetical protein